MPAVPSSHESRWISNPILSRLHIFAHPLHGHLLLSRSSQPQMLYIANKARSLSHESKPIRFWISKYGGRVFPLCICCVQNSTPKVHSGYGTAGKLRSHGLCCALHVPTLPTVQRRYANATYRKRRPSRCFRRQQCTHRRVLQKIGH